MVLVQRIESLFHRLVTGNSCEKNDFLHGNYGPVSQEVFEHDLPVIGTLPLCLNGVFVRNGPNPLWQPTGGYHWFDGDGMTHAVRIKNGTASYNNRFVQTSRFLQERKAGAPLFMKLGDLTGASAIALFAWESFKRSMGWINTKDGAGTGNTALAYHAGRVLALHEGDLPYQLRIMCSGLVETVGRLQLGEYKYPFTAHPKVCPVTGELVFFGYNAQKSPAVVTGLLNSSGTFKRMVPVDLPKPVMIHDCAITTDYIVILDINLEFQPEVMVKQGRLPFVFNKTRGARFGLLRRDATDASAMQWFQLDIPVMIFHTVNAWQEGNVVKLYACTMREFDLSLSERPSRSDPSWPDYQPQVYEYLLDTATGKASWRKLNAAMGEFPVVPADKMGLKAKYMYMGEVDNDVPERFGGIVKIDLATGETVGRIVHGPSKYGGEAVFVPETHPNSEDDGYLLTYVTDETDGQEFNTQLAVYSAKTMSSVPVAAVKLPQRVPYGFHGLHISEEQLKQQKDV